MQRKRIARKLQNPRLERITFHTIRHWKATMEFQRTNSLPQVQEFLGHRDIHSTMVYIHLVNLDADEYITRITKSVRGCRRLIEAGFQYVTELDGVKIFRKPK